MRRTMVIVRRLVLLAFAAAGLQLVATEPANAICEPRGCCPWGAVQSVAPAPGEPDLQYCDIQHCEPLLRH
jgi:hypothetical protein